MKSLLLPLFLACGCAQAPPPAPLTAAEIPYGSGTVADALARCEAAAAAVPAEAAGSTSALEDRLARAELAIAALEVKGVLAAEQVTFDPRQGTMSATNAQQALVTLEDRLKKIEDAVSGASMGKPGPGLFEIEDTRGGSAKGRSAAPPGGGQGGGPPGPPPQGGGGGGPGGGGPGGGGPSGGGGQRSSGGGGPR